MNEGQLHPEVEARVRASFRARASVLEAGRTLTVVRGDAFAVKAGEEKLVATMLATAMSVRGRGIGDQDQTSSLVRLTFREGAAR